MKINTPVKKINTPSKNKHPSDKNKHPRDFRFSNPSKNKHQKVENKIHPLRGVYLFSIPWYPKYSENRSLTKIGKKFFDFFRFFSREISKISQLKLWRKLFFENRRKNHVENFGFQKKLRNRNFISFLSSGENLKVIHWEIRKLEPICLGGGGTCRFHPRFLRSASWRFNNLRSKIEFNPKELIPKQSARIRLFPT